MVWALLPRLLVLYLIYVDQGVSLWFIIHLVVALLVWGGSSGYHAHGLAIERASATGGIG